MEGNLEIFEKEGYVRVSVNPKIYPLEVIYSTAYVFIDDYYVLIDGDPKEKIIIELRPKEKGKDLKILGREFNTELVNYSEYAAKCKRTVGIREAILKRVLLTNDLERQREVCAEEESSFLDDPEGIAVPWEEKYGQSKNKQKKE